MEILHIYLKYFHNLRKRNSKFSFFDKLSSYGHLIEYIDKNKNNICINNTLYGTLLYIILYIKKPFVGEIRENSQEGMVLVNTVFGRN